MINLKEYSVESIRSRMIKNAARIWGSESEDIESSFDPLVGMLIEACAFELSKINSEIHDSQSRVLEQLAQVLSPEIYTATQPSYAIAHARGYEAEIVLKRETQFYAQQKFLNQEQKEYTKDVYFSPAKDYKIFDTDIKYMCVGKSVYEYKSPSTRVLLDGIAIDSLEPYQVWIGLEANPKLNSLDGFSFYFDWKNAPEKESYLQLLPLAKWYFNDKELMVQDGLNQSNLNQSKVSIADQYDVSLRTEDFVTHIYEKNFCTINSKDKIEFDSNLITYPPVFENVFSEKTLEKIDGKFIWIKIVFPGALNVTSLNDLFVSTNAFPVINRKLNKITFQLRSNLNIVPLNSEDFFFDVVNLQNSEGVLFQENPLESGFKNDAGFYTLRNGGIERFDKRSATEFLQSTIELLRDESASFSSLGNDFISTYINQINQSIAMIENRLSSKGESSKPSHFVIINPIKQNEIVFINYWSTNGLEGNGIKPGTKLNSGSGTEVRSNSLMLITSSAGGKKPASENEKINAFRRSIITHDRLVTQEDIITFCFNELGNMVLNVEVLKNWELSSLPNQGFNRILEILITLKSSQKISAEDLNTFAHELQIKIERFSSNLIPIRVKLK